MSESECESKLKKQLKKTNRINTLLLILLVLNCSFLFIYVFREYTEMNDAERIENFFEKNFIDYDIQFYNMTYKALLIEFDGNNLTIHNNTSLMTNATARYEVLVADYTTILKLRIQFRDTITIIDYTLNESEIALIFTNSQTLSYQLISINFHNGRVFDFYFEFSTEEIIGEIK